LRSFASPPPLRHVLECCPCEKSYAMRGDFPQSLLPDDNSISAVKGFHSVIELGGLALPRQTAPIDCDRFDHGEDLASGGKSQRGSCAVMRTPRTAPASKRPASG